MTAEPLGDATYKLTLDKAEAADLPHNGRPRDMERFIRSILDRFAAEQGLKLPDGKLLVEAFLRSDESLVLFISPLHTEQKTTRPHYYACDISGIELLRQLCTALCDIPVRCNIYCGSTADRYRLVFTDPPPEIQRVCTEYGEYGEISPLFAAQTQEYLTLIAQGSGAQIISKMLY